MNTETVVQETLVELEGMFTYPNQDSCADEVHTPTISKDTAATAGINLTRIMVTE